MQNSANGAVHFVIKLAELESKQPTVKVMSCKIGIKSSLIFEGCLDCSPNILLRKQRMSLQTILELEV